MAHNVKLVKKYEYEPVYGEWYEEDGIENLSLYNPGGLHPVDIGDLINGRFEAFRKLGAGGFGVVWLCIDNQSAKWCALKMMAAIHSVGDTNNEIEVLEHLRSRYSPEELVRNHIAAPTEHFYINGPNGRHLCYVLPVLGLPVSSWSLSTDPVEESTLVTIKDVCRQLTRGVRFLHRNGIVHGDLTPNNVLMKLNGIDGLTKDQMVELVADPEIVPVATTSGVDPGPHAPKYFTKSVSQHWCKEICVPEIAVIDFGESFQAGNPRGKWGVPLPYAAPEVVFPEAATGADWFSSDVWSLACTILDIRTGSPFFESCNDPESLVNRLELLFGPLPERYLVAWNTESSEARQREATLDEGPSTETLGYVTWESTSLAESREDIIEGTGCTGLLEGTLLHERYFIRQDTAENPDDEMITYRYPREDTLALADLLNGMLKYDFRDRLNMEQICQHSWLDARTRSQVISQILWPGVRTWLGVFYLLASVLGLIAILTTFSPSNTGGIQPAQVTVGPGYCPAEDNHNHPTLLFKERIPRS